MSSMRDTNYKGNVAEAVIAAEAIKLGIDVMKPLTEHARYDLIFDVAGRLLRVQCKWGRLRNDVVVVNLAGYRLTSTGSVRSVYTADEIDAVAVYCEDLDQCYLLPAQLVAGRRGMHLRIRPPKNGQRAAVNWAAEYELGAVAQLGERLSGTQEVTGSSPVSSTTSTPRGSEAVGSHEFRCLFGWYAQRAAAGHEVLVTRRGKPYVRLLPARDQLDLDAAASNGASPGP
jgi:prevent-host-death family protein